MSGFEGCVSVEVDVGVWIEEKRAATVSRGV